MNAKQLKQIVDNSDISSCNSMKQSIRKRLETAAYNGFYHIIFDHRSFDGPFLLPERVRKVFLEDLTKDGFVVECETRWWKTKTIKISWLVPPDLESAGEIIRKRGSKFPFIRFRIGKQAAETMSGPERKKRQ